MNSTNTSSTSFPPLPIDVLLSYAGFLPFESITYVYVIPIVCVVGLVLCSLSVFIFFRSPTQAKEFTNEPVYVYFKVISFIYLLNLLALIPHSFCFTASAIYLPQMNIKACIIFQLVYLPVSNLFFHYTAMLEFIIVLDRLKVNYKFFKNDSVKKD